MPSATGAKPWWRRPWFRNTGMHVAPKRGEVFPTGPQEVYDPEGYDEPGYDRRALGETSTDLLVPLQRPYVPEREIRREKVVH